MSVTPNRATVEEEVLSAVTQAAGRSNISISPDNDIYGDIGLDSLDAVTVFSRLSEVFSIPEPRSNEEFYNLRRVREIVDYVCDHLAAGTR